MAESMSCHRMAMLRSYLRWGSMGLCVALKPSFLVEIETKSSTETSLWYKTLKTRIECDALNMYHILETSIMNADILINNTV